MSVSEELLSDENLGSDKETLDLLRPSTLEDFIGQEDLKKRLTIMLDAAQQRGHTLDHLLFAGPPGLGKTTLAKIVANHLDTELSITSGPVLERAGDLAAILTRLKRGDVLFIDEIHRLSKPIEEILYPALEESRLDIILGSGPAARSVSIELEPFTMVAATTRTSLITGPLRDRFGLAERLDYYTNEDLEKIVNRAGKVLKMEIAPDAAAEIAKRARGTPRIANRLLRRVRDFAQIQAPNKSLDRQLAQEGLKVFGMDELGLDKVDISILETICLKYKGGPVGLGTLAIAVGEPTDTVEYIYEPFLIQQGLIHRTSKGRMATERSWKHLKVKPPTGF